MKIENKKILIFPILIIIILFLFIILINNEFKNSLLSKTINSIMKQENLIEFEYDYYRQTPNGKFITLVTFRNINGIDKISYLNQSQKEIIIDCNGKTEVALDFEADKYTHYYFQTVSSTGEKKINDLYLDISDLTYYLYDNGNEFIDRTGGWSIANSQQYSGIEKGSNYMKIWYNSGYYNVGFCSTINKIDISKYTKLHVVANYTGSHCSTYTGRIQVTTSTNNVITSNFYYTNGQNSDYVLDLSAITGLCNIDIWGCAQMYIYEVYLANE